MELMKIVGGLAAIAAIVVFVGLNLKGGDEGAAAAKKVDRSFASGSSSARFVSVATE